MTIKLIIVFAASFVLAFLLGRAAIPILRALRAGQSIREIGPKWHQSKEGTPTMGGVIFIIGTLACLTVSGNEFRSGDFKILYLLLFSLAFGCIGFLDDYVKVRYHRNLGLTAIQKFSLQLVCAGAYLAVLHLTGNLTNAVYLPFWNITFVVPWVIYYAVALFALVGTVNAVNLTDGIDGLATGVTMPIMLFFALVAVKWHDGATAWYTMALFGALGAFLCYNFNPAKVFMGDTGSLFLGAAVSGAAFALDMPLILIPVGFIYIVETVSVILQVSYFKFTHGKRIFRMTPIHHHFEMGGWSEKKIFAVFTAVTVLCCILAWLGVMHRI